jgi:hypothetical protein
MVDISRTISFKGLHRWRDFPTRRAIDLAPGESYHDRRYWLYVDINVACADRKYSLKALWTSCDPRTHARWGEDNTQWHRFSSSHTALVLGGGDINGLHVLVIYYLALGYSNIYNASSEVWTNCIFNSHHSFIWSITIVVRLAKQPKYDGSWARIKISRFIILVEPATKWLLPHFALEVHMV